jgi:heme A synthase
MYDFVLNAHSGLRYLILLVGVLTALIALVGMAQKQPVSNAGLTLLRVFVVLVDIQLLLGVLTLVTGTFYMQLIGHLVMMVAAVAMAHLAASRLRKAAPEARSNGQLLTGALIPLALIVAGILAIQRPII